MKSEKTKVAVAPKRQKVSYESTFLWAASLLVLLFTGLQCQLTQDGYSFNKPESIIVKKHNPATGVTFYEPSRARGHQHVNLVRESYFYIVPYISILQNDKTFLMVRVNYGSKSWIFIESVLFMIDGNQVILSAGPRDVDQQVVPGGGGLISETVDFEEKDSFLQRIAKAREVYVTLLGRHRRESWKLNEANLRDVQLIVQKWNELQGKTDSSDSSPSMPNKATLRPS